MLRTLLLAVTATGATPPTQGTDIGTDAQGRYRKRFTPMGDAPVTLRIHTCAFAPGLETLSRVCQDALVVRGELVVEPAEVTLSAGGTHQFTAELLGLPTSAVAWTATGGTITSGGLYTAGSQAGTFAVTARGLGAAGGDSCPVPYAAVRIVLQVRPGGHGHRGAADMLASRLDQAPIKGGKM